MLDRRPLLSFLAHLAFAAFLVAGCYLATLAWEVVP